LTGELLPYKKSSSSSLQIAATLDELEAPIPMDVTPNSTLQLPARPFIKASRKKKKVSPFVSLFVFVEQDFIDTTN
jgi:hypothetical protein